MKAIRIVLLAMIVLVFWKPEIGLAQGQVIAFVSYRDGNWEIYSMNPDGSGKKNLTNHSGWDFDFSWSPDGKKIAFVTSRDDNYEIYVMNSDGSDQRNLTNCPSPDTMPTWSPDGSKIVFLSAENVGKMYLASPDSSELTLLIGEEIIEGPISWSPDGKQITFVSYKDGFWKNSILSLDSLESSILTDDSSSDWGATWKPTLKLGPRVHLPIFDPH